MILCKFKLMEMIMLKLLYTKVEIFNVEIFNENLCRKVQRIFYAYSEPPLPYMTYVWVERFPAKL